MSRPTETFFKKRVLPNGVRLLTEKIPHVRSVAIGIFLDAGSRDELPRESGLAHCIEHMFFKGTPSRDTQRIAVEMNNLGGHINACTSHESICVHGKVVDERLAEGLDLLSDMFCNSIFPDEELNRERNVILEEIRLCDDTPDDLIFEKFTAALWKDSALGRPVIGSPQTVRRFTSRDIQAFCRRHYSPERVIVAVAGNFETRRLNRLLERHFSALCRGTRRPLAPRPRPSFCKLQLLRPLEQAHFCIGNESLRRDHRDRYDYALMNMILGGGANSRVFQEVREKRGLAYNVGSTYRSYRDTGYFAVYGGTSPRLLRQVIAIVLGEIRKICREPVSPAELDNAKDALRGGILLGLESTFARMNRLADQELSFGRYVPLEEIIAGINRVTPRAVRRCAQKYLQDQPAALAVIGPQKLNGRGAIRF